jgi:glutathione S-transferase
LSTRQRADCAALSALVDEQLHDAMLHFFWLHDDNFEHVTRKLYGDALPFPLGYVVRTRRRHQIAAQLAAVELADVRVAASAVRSVCNALAERLADAAFFFGARPSSLDGAAFGFLAVALHAPLPDTTLRDAVSAHANLVAFVERILRDHFHSPDVPLAPPVVVQPSDAKFIGWSVPIPVPKFRPLTRAEYARKRADFFFITGAIALVGVFWLTSRLAETPGDAGGASVALKAN